MSVESDADLRLDDSKHWRRWNDAFIFQATDAGLWKFINPRSSDYGQFLEELKIPEFKDYEARPIETTDDLDSNEEFVPQSAADLSEYGFKSWRLDCTAYPHRQQRYERQQDKIEGLRKWVRKTVASHWVQSACRPEDGLHVWYRNLRKLVGTRQCEEEAVRDEYERIIRPTKKPKDMFEWIQNWERVMTKAKECGLGRVAEASDWYPEFGRAVKALGYGFWYEAQRSRFEDAMEDNTLDYRKVAKVFRFLLREDGPTDKPRPVVKGAFLAFDGVEATGDESSAEEKTKRKRSSTPPPKNKKRRTGCFACDGIGHKVAKCYYVFPEKAPEDFVFNEELRQAVNERLKSDRKLRQEVERLRGRKKKG
ncbi:hypothetical protein VTN31DRAFT_2708 [Thermomyces dupontii]|uniref:uncharacterized protein n=1 Tax=Talaromyces thermophilus TaxID=28565 RepID=UPI00374423D1